jgi:hypothetical protein
VVGSRLSWIDINVQRQTAMATSRATEQKDIGGTDITEAFTRLQELRPCSKPARQASPSFRASRCSAC